MRPGPLLSSYLFVGLVMLCCHVQPVFADNQGKLCDLSGFNEIKEDDEILIGTFDPPNLDGILKHLGGSTKNPFQNRSEEPGMLGAASTGAERPLGREHQSSGPMQQMGAAVGFETSSKSEKASIVFLIKVADLGEPAFLSVGQRKKILEAQLPNGIAERAKYFPLYSSCIRRIVAKYKQTKFVDEDDDFQWRMSILSISNQSNKISPDFNELINFGYISDSKLNDLQQKLFIDGFNYFVRLNTRQRAAREVALIPVGHYYQFQSIASWLDRYHVAVYEYGSDSYFPKFPDIQSLINARRESDIPWLYYLVETTLPAKLLPQTSYIREMRFDERPVSRENYHMDIESYVTDRLSKSVVNFIENNKIKIYLHNVDDERGLMYHMSEGFTKAWALKTPRGRRQKIFFLKNPRLNEYRIAVTRLYNEDLLFHVGSTLTGLMKERIAYSVIHEHKPEIIQPLKKINFTDRDVLVMGVRSNLIDMLNKTKHTWTEEPYSKNIVDIVALRDSSKNSPVFVSARNVYGDMIYEVIDFFYKQGIRKFIYFGTAGAFDNKVPLGTVFSPQGYFDINTREFLLANGINLSQTQRLIVSRKHACVRTMLEENLSLVESLVRESFDSIDVEGCHIQRFLRAHKDMHGRILFVISDHVLGEETYDSFGEPEKNIVKDSIKSVLPIVFQNELHILN